MKESMIFPREEKTEILFQKILEDPWACEKLYLRLIEIVISRHS